MQTSRGKGNRAIRDIKDAAVGDSNFVSISSQIINGVAKTVEGLLDKRAPILLIKGILKGIPGDRILEGLRKGKDSFGKQRVELRKEFSTELIAEDLDRDEERLLGEAELVIRGNASAGNNAVHMDMIVQFLVPGMKDLNDTRKRAKIFFVCRKFQKRFSCAAMQKIVEQFLILVEQGIQFMRKREDNMEIGSIYDFRAALIYPQFFFYRLTVGAVAVAAGVGICDLMTAVLALRNRIAQCASFAVQDSKGSFQLFF